MIAIEEINGKKYTVVWYDAVNFSAVDLELYEASVIHLPNGVLIFPSYSGKAFAVALPALPRHPKPEHAPLLYRYASENLRLCGTREELEDSEEHSFGARWVRVDSDNLVLYAGTTNNIEITHATRNGTRVEIAIEEVI